MSNLTTVTKNSSIVEKDFKLSRKELIELIQLEIQEELEQDVKEKFDELNKQTNISKEWYATQKTQPYGNQVIIPVAKVRADKMEKALNACLPGKHNNVSIKFYYFLRCFRCYVEGEVTDGVEVTLLYDGDKTQHALEQVWYSESEFSLLPTEIRSVAQTKVRLQAAINQARNALRESKDTLKAYKANKRKHFLQVIRTELNNSKDGKALMSEINKLKVSVLDQIRNK